MNLSKAAEHNPEHTLEEIQRLVEQQGYFINRQWCLGCMDDPTDLAATHCTWCLGTGHLVNVPWVTDPWNEVVPNLWVGGHDYDPRETGYPVEVTQHDLDEAGFDLVVSMYARDCPPAEEVEHLEMLFDDHPLALRNVEDLQQVWTLATLVAQAVSAGRKTLVRCQAGMNRSSLVAGLAMVNLGYEPGEIVGMIRAKRSRFALFNTYFVHLIEIQEKRDGDPHPT